MRVLIDWDDVVNDLMDVVVDTYNAEYSPPISLDMMTDFVLRDCFPEEVVARIEEIWTRQSLWDALKPKPGAIATLQQMLDDGVDAYLGTATHYSNFEWKMNWLRKYASFFPADRVVVCCHKGIINADYAIDDRVDNLRAGSYGRIVITKPWNAKAHDVIFGLYRAADLPQAYRYIKKEERGTKSDG